MKDWERIRGERRDLTDYVVHLTKGTWNDGKPKSGLGVLLDILRAGVIRPTFALRGNRKNPEPQPTIQGTIPVVCLTEQPLWAILETLPIAAGRYDGYGMAFYKPFAYNDGARPVLYATEQELYALPNHLKFLWARYQPEEAGSHIYPFDFTWEREWRMPVHPSADPRVPKGMKVASWRDFSFRRPVKTSIIVRVDEDVAAVRSCLDQLAAAGKNWAGRLRRIISLETAEWGLESGDERYGKIETWPEEDA